MIGLLGALVATLGNAGGNTEVGAVLPVQVLVFTRVIVRGNTGNTVKVYICVF